MTEPEIQVKRVRSIIPDPSCKWWRHPIVWWKLRHLRADLRWIAEEEERNPLRGEARRALDRLEAMALLFGDRPPGGPR